MTTNWNSSTRTTRFSKLFFIAICSLSFIGLTLSAAKADEKAGAPEHKDMGAVGAKLANPLSDLWSLSMSFEVPKFFDGDLNTGNPEVGADMILQPVLPIPLYGEGAGEWRMITRPVIPLIFSQPIPRGSNNFYDKGGIGDIQLPMMLSIPDQYAGKWILGGGPIFMFPSATTDVLGADQYAMGPAVVVGYKAKNWTGVLFPNYFWKTGSSGQDDATPNINQGTLLYSFTYKLANAWQVGTNPTISYNHQATAGNKWNVPVGLYIGKTVTMGKMPVNIKAGLEYSVVSEDVFGKRLAFRFQITPVVKGLISNPIFGK
ncbi:MAG: hypothetical protein JRJ15_13920 [Deltaproteobacteria bacterium]|nr:hypothetical protein [Deltaproteobacteria bacterium]